MGRSRRPRPERLAEKLLQIRMQLGLTQEGIVERLAYTRSPLVPSQISEFERGLREPPVQVLLHYARMAGVPMEMLIDDGIDLPDRFPGMPEYERMMKKVRTG